MNLQTKSPETTTRLLNQARHWMERGDISAADVLYRELWRETTPPQTGTERVTAGEAAAHFARRALSDNMHGSAADWYQRAVHADPLCADYRIEYATRALLPMNMGKTALAEAERAIKVEPAYPLAWRAVGLCAHAAGDMVRAAEAYDRQVALDENPLARIDRAAVAVDSADYDTARAMAIPVLETEHRAEALHVLGMCCYREAEHEGAIELYEQALAANPYDPATVRWHLSLAQHAIGRYKEGWANHEARGEQKSDAAMRLIMNRFAAPRLMVGDAPCRVHVHQEMGAGDVLATVRYLPLLTAMGHEVTLEVDESMVGLLARSFPDIKVMAKALDYPSALGVPPFDRHITLLSLPYLFGTEIGTVPWDGPYLKPDPVLVEHFGSRAKRVGLCWSSGIRDQGAWIAEYGRRKSMHFDQLRDILECDTVDQFISLQIGPERKQLDTALVQDILPTKPSWDNTAALVASLDLVITVDTSIAHLAGALGVPTWIMCQCDCASWHFMCWREGAPWNERSPWYPSVQLFRQPAFNQPHEWRGVVEEIAEELAYV